MSFQGSSAHLPRLVVLGCGWGSYSVLRNVSKTVYRIIVISPRNHFLFTPLLASTTTGTLEFRSIIEPIRNSGFRHSEDFHLADAISLKMEDKKITELQDARAVRERLLNNFELSLETGLHATEVERLLHVVIVGGGPTGVEFGAELYDFLNQDISRIYPERRAMVRVTLVEALQILSSFDKNLQAYAEKGIAARRNFTLLKKAVKEVKADCVILNDGQVIRCGLVVWSTGLSARPFIKQLDVPKNRAGQILTDNYLRIPADPKGSVYALGDCADIEGNPLPCTAQVAERQGRYLGLALTRVGHPRDKNMPPPFTFKSLGMLTYLGNYKALVDMPGLKLKGWLSWFLWRSAYLTRLGSWRLRMQVPMDWTKTLIFGRDTSKF